MKRLIRIVILLFILSVTTPLYGFYLYWPPNESSSSYRVYQVSSFDPITLVYIDEVTENRFNIEGYINQDDWTFFGVSNCCGSDCSQVFSIVGILDIDASLVPMAEGIHYQLEVKLTDPAPVPQLKER